MLTSESIEYKLNTLSRCVRPRRLCLTRKGVGGLILTKGIKMKIGFEYEETGIGHALKMKSDNGSTLEVCFDCGEPSLVVLDDDFEFEPLDDRLYGIFLKIKDNFHSLHNIMQHAYSQFDDILEEVQREAREEAENAAFLSCPGKTGRI